MIRFLCEVIESYYSIVPAGQAALSMFISSVPVFMGSFCVLGTAFEIEIDKDDNFIRIWGYLGPLMLICVWNFYLRYMYEGFIYDASVRSLFLGAVFAMGLVLSYCSDKLHVFGLYSMVLSLFHFSEFMTVAITNPDTLSTDSFLLNHSIQYGIAAFGSWLEWFLEYYFLPDYECETIEDVYHILLECVRVEECRRETFIRFPSLTELGGCGSALANPHSEEAAALAQLYSKCMAPMKMYYKLAYFGLLLCVIGEVLRKAAMITASTSFTHLVQYQRPANHKLVTHGVYSWCRHPSYVGWFLWSIGTQILLLNPICTVFYAAASWAFFNERIYGEEITLLSFYGKQYRQYQSRVPTGLPFIQGFIISDNELDVAGSHVAGVKERKPDHYSCGHSKVEHRRPQK